MHATVLLSTILLATAGLAAPVQDAPVQGAPARASHKPSAPGALDFVAVAASLDRALRHSTTTVYVPAASRGASLVGRQLPSTTNNAPAATEGAPLVGRQLRSTANAARHVNPDPTPTAAIDGAAGPAMPVAQATGMAGGSTIPSSEVSMAAPTTAGRSPAVEGGASATATASTVAASATAIASSVHCTYDWADIGSTRLQVGAQLSMAEIGDGTTASCKATLKSFNSCMHGHENRITWDCGEWSKHVLKVSWDQDGRPGPQEGEQCLQTVFGVPTTCTYHDSQHFHIGRWA